MSKSFAEEMRVLLRSGWRVIAVETFEEERALSLLEKAAESCERTCLRWSVSSGLGEQGQGAGSLDAGLRAIADFPKPAVFALLDAHRLLDDPMAVRRLRDLIPVFAARKQTVALVGPVLDVPIELVREVGRVELPLPQAAELRSLFGRVLEQSNGPQASDEVLGDAVRGALGLTSSEAVSITPDRLTPSAFLKFTRSLGITHLHSAG